MSVRLRLQRHGSKKRPFYRIVAADQRMPRDGRYREQLGVFNPLPNPNVCDLDLERVDYWLGVGAQPTETVTALIRKVREGGHFITTDEFVAHNREARKQRQAAALAVKEIEQAAPTPTAAPAEAAADAPAEEAPAAEAAAEAPAEEAAAEAPAADEAPAEEAAADDAAAEEKTDA